MFTKKSNGIPGFPDKFNEKSGKYKYTMDRSMNKLFFLLKMILFTIFIVVILQIKVGTSTLEEKVLKAAHYEPVSETFQKFGVKILSSVKKQYRKWNSRVDSFLEKKIDNLQEKEPKPNKDKK